MQWNLASNGNFERCYGEYHMLQCFTFDIIHVSQKYFTWVDRAILLHIDWVVFILAMTTMSLIHVLISNNLAITQFLTQKYKSFVLTNSWDDLNSQYHNLNLMKMGRKKNYLYISQRFPSSIKKRCLNPWVGTRYSTWFILKSFFINHLFIIFIFLFSKYTNYQKAVLDVKINIVMF